MLTIRRVFCASALLLCALAPVSRATPLYADTFDIDDSAAWNVNKGVINSSNVNVTLPSSDSSSSAQFGYDYSALGIPAAPHTLDGSTRGLRLRSNLGPAASVNGATSRTAAVSVSPTAQSFTAPFKLTVDVWGNYVGGTSLNPSGSNATECMSVGIRTAGTTPTYSFNPNGALMFATVRDGGTTNTDYRAYTNAGNAAAASGWYQAGTAAASLDNGNAYYSFLGTHSAPAFQQTTYPTEQTGTTPNGTVSFAWHTMTILDDGTNATWSIDGTPIAVVPLSAATLSGGDILLGSFDTNNGSSAGDGIELNFDLFDNLVVEAVVPEPASLGAVVTLGSP